MELTKIENTPGFAAALQEKENADKEYKEVDEQFINVNKCISTCKEKIRDNEDKYDESEQQIEKAKHEYDTAILQRLELRKEMVELYDKLRIKSDSARVMTTKNVENVRGEKESAIRILENEQRKYWHIIGQSDEKFGIGFIPLFREQYRDMDAFCKSQVERLNAYKDANYTSDTAINILKLLEYVLGNNSDIMERELSVAVLGDTKLFEKSYKSRICSIIEEYGELELDLSVLDKKEKEKAILEEYQVFSNPSYIFFKGNVDIHYVDGSSISVTPDNPIAILSEAMERIEMIKVNSNRIVTVENLTSYNRINDNKSTFIYLSGYHNTAKQRFLKKIAENNSGVSWFHFGDIDPDGYFILKNLIKKTGIAFVPLHMDVQQLKNYKQYCKPLEKNDMVKANSLLKIHFYDEVMEFMLANNCKLEQEIISWLYERN